MNLFANIPCAVSLSRDVAFNSLLIKVIRYIGWIVGLRRCSLQFLVICVRRNFGVCALFWK